MRRITTYVGTLIAILFIASASYADPLDAVMQQIAMGETGNDPNAYTALYGGGHFGFPQWGGRRGPAGISHAAGKHQFQPGTWVTAAKEYIKAGNPAPDFNRPEDQDAVAKFWASLIYKKKTGRDLTADAEIGRISWQALAAEWPSLIAGTKPRTKAQAPAPQAPKSSPEPTGDVKRTNLDPFSSDGEEDEGSSFVITAEKGKGR